MALEINNPVPGAGEVPASLVNVYRSIDGAPEELIMANVPPNTAVTDYSPTVCGTNTYRIEAVSDTPSSSYTVVAVTTPGPDDGTGSLWLSVGPGLSQVCHGWSNIRVQGNADLAERSLYQFAGRTKPLEFAGTATSDIWVVSVDLVKYAYPGCSPMADWLDLAKKQGPFLMRTPDGLYRFVSVRGMQAVRDVGGAVVGVSFVATEVDRD